MRRKIEPLLCELHAHTTWSDGALALPELVDLYGRNAFDVLCVTDHVHRPDDPWRPADTPLRGVHAGNHAEYLAEIEAEAARARREYDLLVVPGLELSYNDLDPNLAAHAVAVGCRAFVGVDDGPWAALARGTARGGGAHRGPSVQRPPGRRALRESHCASPANGAPFGHEVDRWELFNRHDLFGWVGRARPPCSRERRFPPPRAPLRLEDPAAVREGRDGGRRVPALGPPGVPHAHRRARSAATRRVAAPVEGSGAARSWRVEHRPYEACSAGWENGW